MEKPNERRKEILWCMLAAFCVAILANIAAPLQTPAKTNEEKIVLILGGDASMIALDSWPWPRAVHAQLIEEQLGAARVIVSAHLLFCFAGVYLLTASLCTLLVLCGVLQLFGLRALRESRERQQLLMDMIACFVSAIDAKDPITAGHSRRVSEVAARLAAKKGFGKKDVERVRLAGLIHDIGKIGIADTVLHKPGKFTNEEFAEMKRHPDTGAAIMAQAKLPPEIIAGILDHHERPDGRGYPAGKTETDLHLFAEIIKIADVYDALSSKRQYKDAWPLEKVCAVLYEGRGSEFNAELIDLFLADIQPDWSPAEREEA